MSGAGAGGNIGGRNGEERRMRMALNEKGAAGNDAQEKKTSTRILHNSVKERNLVRQIRRRLKKENRTIRSIGGMHYVLDLHPSRVADVKALARILGIELCGICSGGAKAMIDGVLLCRGCEVELVERKVA
jgi:hypothetical protein